MTGLPNATKCCCCCCLNFGFLTSRPGLLKILELTLSGVGQDVLSNILPSQGYLAIAFGTLFKTNTTSVSTVTLLMISYILSKKSFYQVRSSNFEMLFNGSLAISYFCSSIGTLLAILLTSGTLHVATFGLLGFSISTITPFLLGFSLAAVHAVDAYYCYKQYVGVCYREWLTTYSFTVAEDIPTQTHLWSPVTKKDLNSVKLIKCVHSVASSTEKKFSS